MQRLCTFAWLHTRRCIVWLACAGCMAAQAQTESVATSIAPLPLPAQTHAITLVLAGGGAKGFAHLAVLRRLEHDHIRIGRIIGTSMGAVIGSLYASGMSTSAIEKVIGELQPASVALDQVERTELSNREREYQHSYPIDIEFGVKSGQLTFARGLSDGQRLLALLQRLLINVAPQVNFDDLKIPFRAVATRYRDGEMITFRRGNLPLVVRASMAAPGVFAPVEIDGETYVDGGLVANLPVELALHESSDPIVASYVGTANMLTDTAQSGNALDVTSRMLKILIFQNERRNLALLRSEDILVQPDLQGFDFDSFDESADIIRLGEVAVQAQDASFQRLARQYAQAPNTRPGLAASAITPATGPDALVIRRVKVSGNHFVPSAYIENNFAAIIGRSFVPEQVGERVEALYATGDFERVSYQLGALASGDYELQVDVNEKTYGPDYVKTSVGFFSESQGDNQFSLGVGYRRPWLTDSGLELQVDGRAGSQSELSSSLTQPLGHDWSVSTYLSYTGDTLPIYRTDISSAQIIGSSTLREEEVGLRLNYEISQRATASVAVINNLTLLGIDTPRDVSFPTDGGGTVNYHLSDSQWAFSGVSGQLTVDQLNSLSFPTGGYYLKLNATQGLSGVNQYTSYRSRAQWATSLGAHSINAGINLGTDRQFECNGCVGSTAQSALYLGGFQSMGAYHFGQLSGDRLAHMQVTYMYQLSEGGLLRQPTYVGYIAEVGDAWLHTESPSIKHSSTVFIAVDSKIGDIYLGAAQGSDGNQNIFLQLGRRFSLW